MRSIHRTVDIRAPARRVWEFLHQQPNSLTGVWPHLVSVSNIVPRVDGASDFDWVYKMGGVRFSGHAIVEQTRPGEYVRYRNEGGIPSTFVWSHRTAGTSTRVTVDVQYSIPTPVIGKLAEVLVAKSNEHDLDALLQNTKTRLEREATNARITHPTETSP